MSTTEITVTERIIAAADKAALDALQEDAIARPRAIAQELRGIVVTTEADVKHVTDRLSIIKQGQKAAKAALDGVTYVHRKAIDAARGRFDEVQALLNEAESHAKRAIQGYITEQERAAAAERARLQREAEAAAAKQRAVAEAERRRLEAEAVAASEAAARATNEAERERLLKESFAASAAMENVDEAPAMEVAPVAVDTQVRGRTGFVHTTSRLCVEMLHPIEVASFDPTLLQLVNKAALDLYRVAERREELDDAKPHPSGGVVWRGMRFYRETGVAAR